MSGVTESAAETKGLQWCYIGITVRGYSVVTEMGLLKVLHSLILKSSDELKTYIYGKHLIKLFII